MKGAYLAGGIALIAISIGVYSIFHTYLQNNCYSIPPIPLCEISSNLTYASIFFAIIGFIILIYGFVASRKKIQTLK